MLSICGWTGVVLIMGKYCNYFRFCLVTENRKTSLKWLWDNSVFKYFIKHGPSPKPLLPDRCTAGVSWFRPMAAEELALF